MEAARPPTGPLHEASACHPFTPLVTLSGAKGAILWMVPFAPLRVTSGRVAGSASVVYILDREAGGTFRAGPAYPPYPAGSPPTSQAR